MFRGYFFPDTAYFQKTYSVLAYHTEYVRILIRTVYVAREHNKHNLILFKSIDNSTHEGQNN